jgi:pimeloyl-ACP methyl ester carboxylesterase
VRALVLLSGYWFPTPRPAMAWAGTLAMPLIGPLLRHTAAPLIARLAWHRTTKRAFAPEPVPESFAAHYPAWLPLRPRRMQAAAAESAQRLAAVMRLAPHYGELRVPVVIGAGAGDRELSTRWHSLRLHRAIPGSVLHIVDGAGHMLHHTAPELVLGFVDEAARMAEAARPSLPSARVEPRTQGPVASAGH